MARGPRRGDACRSAPPLDRAGRDFRAGGPAWRRWLSRRAGARPTVGIRAVPRVLLNGQVIDADVEGTTVRVALRGSGSQRLGLVSRPLRPWRHGVDDRRELGVAIADIRWA